MRSQYKMKYFLSIIVFGLGYFASAVHADEWTDGYQYISFLAAYGSTNVTQVTIGSPFVNNHNPSGCSSTTSNGWYLTGGGSSAGTGSNNINAALLAAYVAHRRVQLYITTGCMSNQAIILGVAIEPQ